MRDKKYPDSLRKAPENDAHTFTYYIMDGSSPVEEEKPVTKEPKPIFNEAVDDQSAMTSAAVGNQAEVNVEPKSQALMDMQEAGMTPEEAVAASSVLSGQADRKKNDDHYGTEQLAKVSKFRWIFLLVLSLAGTLFWTVEAIYSGRPYRWLALGLLILSAIVSIPGAKIFRLPTRGGLAAMFWSGTFLISAIFGPNETIFNRIPAALPWAGILTLIVLWVAVAIWRKIGRYKVIDIVFSVILVFAALSPLWALIDNITAGLALSLKFNVLSASPEFLTSRLPWFIWPMSAIVFFVLPVAALFALWDQLSALRRKGGRHGGNFFLALAFIGLLPYAFLTFDRAVAEQPEWAEAFHSIAPDAVQEYKAQATEVPALPLEENSAALPLVTTENNSQAIDDSTPPVESSPLEADSEPASGQHEMLSAVEDEAPISSKPQPTISSTPDLVPTESTPVTAGEADPVDEKTIAAAAAIADQTAEELFEAPLKAGLLTDKQRLSKTEHDLAETKAELAETKAKIDEMESQLRILIKSQPQPQASE